MSFNDDDLKRLKDILVPGDITFFDFSLDALIARLEAAERVCGIVSLMSRGWLTKEQIMIFEAWRKASGK